MRENKYLNSLLQKRLIRVSIYFNDLLERGLVKESAYISQGAREGTY